MEEKKSQAICLSNDVGWWITANRKYQKPTKNLWGRCICIERNIYGFKKRLNCWVTWWKWSRKINFNQHTYWSFGKIKRLSENRWQEHRWLNCIYKKNHWCMSPIRYFMGRIDSSSARVNFLSIERIFIHIKRHKKIPWISQLVW